MNKIIIVEKDSINEDNKKLLNENGYAVIEITDTSRIVFVGESDNHNLLMAAIRGACNDTLSKAAFADNLYRRLLDDEAKNK